MKTIVKRRSGPQLFFAAALCVTLGANGSAAPQLADSAQAKAKLAAVRARIAELTGRLGTELTQRDALSARLRETELAVTAKRQRLDALRANEAAVEHRRADLRSEQNRVRAGLQVERDALAAEVRAAYIIGPREELKMLLNQDDPAVLGRTLTYYGYFAQQRGRNIQAIQTEAARLEALTMAIDGESDTLRSLDAAASQEIAGLQKARADRSDAVGALDRQLASGTQQLAKLKREEQAVESLVAELARVVQDLPLDSAQGFASMRGKLPWPVVGRVSARYQAPRENAASGFKWNGAMIDAARGAKVRAPYFGRVLYADWLQGLGLLLIIGHSGGYMTLYGHAEELYKSVGDKVAPGDVIAALSDTAAAAPQLYFEIRDGRKTVDPMLWLRATP